MQYCNTCTFNFIILLYQTHICFGGLHFSLVLNINLKNYQVLIEFQKLPKVNKELAEKLLDAEESILEKKTKKVGNYQALYCKTAT